MNTSLMIAPKKSPARNSYERLREKVRVRLELGRRRLEKFADKEKILMLWDVGKMIKRYAEHEEKSESGHFTYGKRTAAQLADDFGLKRDRFYFANRLGRAYPIVLPAKQLGFSFYWEAFSIEDEAKITAVLQQAERGHWTRAAFRDKVAEIKKEEAKGKKKNGKKQKTKHLFIPKRGRLNTYQIHSIQRGKKSALYLDRGFSLSKICLPASAKLKEGDIVRGVNRDKIPNATKADLYTYSGSVERVVDGDTIWLVIDIGFGDVIRQKLRLRGIDAPELNTKAGLRAKRFVEDQLREIVFVTVTTTKPDKWDRYLSDIWIGETNLNKLLLDTGHAKLKTDYSNDDWNDSNWGRF